MTVGPMLRFAVVVGVLLVIAPYVGARAEDNLAGKVIGIQDGDTLTLLDPEHRQHRIRIAGIDAPEKGQPFGRVAQDGLAALAYNRLASAHCPKSDRYGRRVCVVIIEGTDIGLAQVKAGLAWHYKRFASEQTEEERTTYALAEAEARAARSGLWQDRSPTAPWDWRHRKQVPDSAQGPTQSP